MSFKMEKNRRENSDMLVCMCMLLLRLWVLKYEGVQIEAIVCCFREQQE